VVILPAVLSRWAYLRSPLPAQTEKEGGKEEMIGEYILAILTWIVYKFRDLTED
jgi:hypothetical protein